MEQFLHSFITLALCLGILVYGMSMIWGGPSTANASYRWMRRELLVKPLRALGRTTARVGFRLLRRTLALLWRGINFLSRKFWVWLTT